MSGRKRWRTDAGSVADIYVCMYVRVCNTPTTIAKKAVTMQEFKKIKQDKEPKSMQSWLFTINKWHN